MYILWLLNVRFKEGQRPNILLLLRGLSGSGVLFARPGVSRVITYSRAVTRVLCRLPSPVTFAHSIFQAISKRSAMTLKTRKILVAWKLREDVVKALKQEAEAKGFPSMPAYMNYLLFNRYFGKMHKKDKKERHEQ